MIYCSDDYDNIVLPEDECIDINEDGRDDFKIQYRKVNIDELPFEADRDTFTYDRSVFCSIFPIDDNESLLIEQIPGWKYPQLSLGDTIFQDLSSSYFWGGKRTGNLMVIKRFNDIENWEENWAITDNQFSTNTPYIVFKINSTNQSELCWLRLNLSTSSGEVQITNHNCVNSNLIVVGE